MDSDSEILAMKYYKSIWYTHDRVYTSYSFFVVFVFCFRIWQSLFFLFLFHGVPALLRDNDGRYLGSCIGQRLYGQ